MRAGLLILFLIPVSLVLVMLNCAGWVVARLGPSGLPVRMGMGWPWHYYTYAVNRVEPSELSLITLLWDLAVAIGILCATAALVLLFTRRRKEEGWR